MSRVFAVRRSVTKWVRVTLHVRASHSLCHHSSSACAAASCEPPLQVSHMMRLTTGHLFCHLLAARAPAASPIRLLAFQLSPYCRTNSLTTQYQYVQSKIVQTSRDLY